MLSNNTSAENYYLSMPMFSSGVDLLANTLSDLLLKEHIVLIGNSYNVALNCDPENRPDHEKLVLANIKNEEIHLKKLVYLSLSKTTSKDYKNLVYSVVKQKGFVRFKFLPTIKGLIERNKQNFELRKYSEIILKQSKPEIIELTKLLGGNIYLLNGKTKRILKDVYPRSINARRQIQRFMGASGLSDIYGDIFCATGIGFGYSGGGAGGFSGGGFSGGGGGSFGGAGAGGSW
jgi:uncharacterized membrane protein YgcG